MAYFCARLKFLCKTLDLFVAIQFPSLWCRCPCIANPPRTTSILSQLCVNLAFTFCCILNPYNPCPCFYMLNKQSSHFLLPFSAPCAWWGAGSEVTSPRQDIQMQITGTGNVCRGVTSAWRQGEKNLCKQGEEAVPVSTLTSYGHRVKSWNIAVGESLFRDNTAFAAISGKGIWKGLKWVEQIQVHPAKFLIKEGLFPVLCESHFSL